MERTIWMFLSLTLVALALVPSGAHLAELGQKITLSAHDYLIVQRLYQGWALFGIVVVCALISTARLAIISRGERRTFALTLTAFLCIAATQVVFWVFTQPVNRMTHNWTDLPVNWVQLRARWEYSHAAGAILNLAALISLFVATFHDKNNELRKLSRPT
jgi:hypothetical protein